MTIFNLLPLVLVLGMAAKGGGSSRTVPYRYGGQTLPHPNPYGGQTVSFDELLLALQWPTSVCNTQNNCYILDYFTVHGLWLNKDSISVCCDRFGFYSDREQCPTWAPLGRGSIDPGAHKVFRPLQINENLRREMLGSWPDLLNPKDPEKFWVYEYRRHGYCFPEFGNPGVYFQTAHAILTKIGLDRMTMRLSSGKPLTKGNSYEVKDFKPVTIAAGSFIPKLRCSNSKVGVQLQEIVLCTDSNMKLKDCASVSNCEMIGKGITPPWSGPFKFP